MTPNRTDLDSGPRNSTYIVLTVILVILSLTGFYLLNHLDLLKVSPSASPAPEPEITGEVTPIPSADTVPDNSPSPVATVITPTALPTPTPEFTEFNSADDKFALTIKSNRKLYQDTEKSGRRYTFYRPEGNISIHTGTSWSWIYPDRQFTSDLLVSGQPTFVYQVADQTIIDLQVDDLKYTIQCVHRGENTLRQECDALVSSFKLL